MNENLSLILLILLNLSTTATFGTEKSGHCREVAVVESLKQSECMDSRQKNGCCREVAVSGGVTVHYWFTLLSNHLPVSQILWISLSNNSKVILKRKLQSPKDALQREPQNQIGQEKENFVKLSLTKLMSVMFSHVSYDKRGNKRCRQVKKLCVNY